MGRPPIGKTAMTDAERHKRYMARLRARAAAGDNVNHNKPTPTGQGIQFEWDIGLDDKKKGYISAYEAPYYFFVSHNDDALMFWWFVVKDNGDENGDFIDVAEGEEPSLVAAMAAAEAAALRNRGR
jgi:hypothetical protein